MSETPVPRRPLRSIGAVFAGLVAIVVLSTATDMALHSSGVYPAGERMADGLFLLALAYRIAYGVAGCFITARLAPDRPLGHALALGAIGTLLSIVGAVAMWDAGPPWYSLANIAIPIPSAWAAASLAGRRGLR
jgi:hypothetical protein